MVFVHSARTPKDIIYHRELEHMNSRINNFKLHLICEKYEMGESWAGYRGFLNKAMLQLMAPDFLEREVFCCGPTPYMHAVKRLLEAEGYDMSRYHEEAFGPTPPEVRADVKELAAEAAEAPAVPLAEQNLVEFCETGKSIRVAPGETVHAAAAQLGLHIPKACGMGICGTCKVMKRSGEVEMGTQRRDHRRRRRRRLHPILLQRAQGRRGDRVLITACPHLPHTLPTELSTG
jgi:Flavodoxin reductases (ferredoxin-NADPH reductases) family 1